MLKPLRHPTSFVLLTCVVAGWFYGTSLAGPSWPGFSVEHKGVLLHRVGIMLGLRDERVLTIGSIRYEPSVLVLREASGELSMHDIRDYDWNAREAMPAAASYVTATRNTRRGYGLMMPVATLDTYTYSASIVTSDLPFIDSNTSIAAVKAADRLPPERTWEFNVGPALHDAAMALALLAWLYALLTIPAWKLWRNLTPAQRRRQRHACPSCGYDRSATPDKPCPECGLNSTNTSSVS